jgi:hypothetical protein
MDLQHPYRTRMDFKPSFGPAAFTIGQGWYPRTIAEVPTCLNSRFMFDLQHDHAHASPGLMLHALPMLRSKWDRITIIEAVRIRTTSEPIKKVEESCSLPCETAKADFEG